MRAVDVGEPQAQGGTGRDERERLDQLQRLWTPWRMSYVQDTSGADQGCPFCVLPRRPASEDAESLILHRGRQAFALLNAYPYNPGHLMAVPYRHVDGIDACSPSEVRELADLCRAAVVALKASSGPQAFNIGINQGAVAGAGIADHVHQHVVPRWGGDTNFMPVIGQTRVLPQLLDETYQRLAPAFATAVGDLAGPE